MGVSSTAVGLVCTAIVLIFSIGYYFMFFREENEVDKAPLKSANAQDKVKKKTIDKKKPTPKAKTCPVKTYNAKTALSHATDLKTHPLYWRELGGHTVAATCVAFSHPQHDLVASGSADGSIRCVAIADLGTPSPCEVYTKMDAAPDAMSFTQNAKRLIVASNGYIYFYSIAVSQKLRKIELVKSFPCSLTGVHSLQLLDVEQWMMVVVAGRSPNDNTPTVHAFNPKGHLLNEFRQVKRQGRADKNRPPNAKKALIMSSPDDRFVAICGCGESNRSVGDGEVGIFEVERDSAGHTKGLKLSFALAGHASDVLAVAWNATGKRMVTCCEDGVWRLWDTSVRYNEVEQPRLFSGHQTLPDKLRVDHAAVMNGDVVAFVCGTTLLYCLHGNGEVQERLDEFTSSAVIASSASFDGQYLATVVKDCRRIPIWKSLK